MTARELLALFRIEVSDLAEPYLWSNAQVIGYLDDAQKQFCRLTEGIEDGRSFKISITAGKEWYALSPQILKLRKVTDAATGRELKVTNIERMTAEGMFFDGRTGPVGALVTGIEKHSARAWPLPSVDTLLHLSTFRLPETLSSGDEPEIDEQHHRHLLLWAKSLAYDVQDSESYDRRKVEEYDKRFRAYCVEAKKEQERARRVVGTVIYGGI